MPSDARREADVRRIGERYLPSINCARVETEMRNIPTELPGTYEYV